MRRRTTPRSAARSEADLAADWFLASSVIGALNTRNAQKPFARTGPFSVASFFTGWITSEMPLHAIAWQALATAGFIRRGALRSPKGWLGLGLSVGSWAALHQVWKQSMEAGEVFDRALEEGLGDDLYEGDLVPPRPAADAIRRSSAPGPLGLRAALPYLHQANIPYGPAGRRNTLDVWKRWDLPNDAAAPVLVEVHGGAWIIGNKQQQAMPLMAHLAEHGWICVSINYRLSPRATWPDHIVDVKRALAWVKEHIADYGGDPGFVAITGGSAGGHLSSLAALTPNEPAFQPGFEDADTSVAAAVPFYGVYDWTNRDGTGRSDMEEMLGRIVLKASRAEAPEIWDQASTMSWVGPEAPPMFIVHGTNDSLVPVEQARSFAAMVRAASHAPVVYAELPGAQHAFEIFNSPRTLYTAGAVHRFLESVRAPAGRHEAITPEPAPTPS